MAHSLKINSLTPEYKSVNDSTEQTVIEHHNIQLEKIFSNKKDKKKEIRNG